MRHYISLSFALLLFISMPVKAYTQAADLFDLVQERTKAIVALEFVVEREVDRREGEAFGLIIDDAGTIVVLEDMIPSWVPLEKMKDFVGYSLPSDDEEYPLDYLGKDYQSGWHILRFKEGLPEYFRPITDFEVSTARMGDEVFGVGGTNKDLGFEPFVLTGRVALTKALPDRQIYFQKDIGSPGCAFFTMDGAFAGWIQNSLSYNRVMTVGRETLNVTMTNPEESAVALCSDYFFDYLEHIDIDGLNGERPWMGVSGMQPIDPEVAEYLGIENQAGVVLSEIIEGSPSLESGLENNDILITVDGEALPRFRPDYSVTPYLQKLIRRKKPGETMEVEVIRGEERMAFSIVMGQGPKLVREAEYRYFEDLGFTVREFLMSDGIRRRVPSEEMKGAIVNFVLSSSAVETAGLRSGDWIRQIEGEEIHSYEDVLRLLESVAEDEDKAEFVMLIERKNETSFIRTSLK